MKRLVLVAAMAVLAMGCGAYAAPGSSSSPTPSSRGGLGYDVTATQTDHVATLRVGQRLEVVLRAAGGMSNWTHPDSSDPSILAPIVDPAATAVRGVTLAAFEARRPGQAALSATSSPLCSPGQECPMLIALYSLRVSVTP